MISRKAGLPARTGWRTDQRCAAGGLSFEEQEALVGIKVTEILPRDGEEKAACKEKEENAQDEVGNADVGARANL